MSVSSKLTEGDRSRVAAQSTKNFKAWLLSAEGYGEYLRFTREGMVRARELWQAAEAEDPNFATPVAGTGLTHWAEARWGWSKSRENSLGLATEYAERAIEMAPAEPLGYMALGTILFLRNQPEQAIKLRRMAIELAPNDFAAVAGLAIRLSEFGQEEEAVRLLEHSLRLSPKPP